MKLFYTKEAGNSFVKVPFKNASPVEIKQGGDYKFWVGYARGEQQPWKIIEESTGMELNSAGSKEIVLNNTHRKVASMVSEKRPMSYFIEAAKKLINEKS